MVGCAPAGDQTETRAPQVQSSRDPNPVADRVNADSAWTALTTQVAFGPRVPGTEGHRRCGDWLVRELQRRGGRVQEDAFSYRDTTGTTWPLRNILGRFGPEGHGRLLLVAHWDTRPWADEDPDPARRNDPILGASDGASGVAVLLEVMRVLQGETLPRGVDILLTDGEDLGRPGNPEGYCQGARRFARQPLTQYWRGIVVDLVGDTDLQLRVEANSMERAPEVVDWIWARGTHLEPRIFSVSVNGAIYDDHMPLIDAGLPTADIIDLQYWAWHTHADDLPAVSAASLVAVARVLASLTRSP